MVTQFLPGGRRSFQDWLPALLFLLMVSLVVSGVLVGALRAGRWLRCWVNARGNEHPMLRKRPTKLRVIYLGALGTGVAVLLAIGFWKGPSINSRTGLIQISVDASRSVRTVDARHFGVNTAIWDAILDTPETVSALAEMDLKVLRFGGFSDEYHWASSTLRRESKPTPSSFSNFINVATNVQAQAVVTVNYGSGTPEEAAAWVRFANITNRCGFKYWEIGNENYGNWEPDENTHPQDAVTYAKRAQEYFRQMKEADPTIKIGVVVTECYKDRAGVLLDALKRLQFRRFIIQGYQGWTPKLFATLKQLGLTPDWVSVHYYPQNVPGLESDARLLQSTTCWKTLAAAVRRHLRTYFGDVEVEMLCTENNSVNQSTGKQTTSIVNALYLADSFGQIVQTEFNSFLWWDLRNVQDKRSNNSLSLYGWRPYGDHGIMSGQDTRYPTFYALKLLKYFARGGDRIVQAGSNSKLLSVYAARRADNTLALLVINKSPQATLSATIALAGFEPDSEATVFSYGIPQDEATRTGVGSPDIAESSLAGAGGGFSSEFAPYSLTVIVLRPASKAARRKAMAHSGPINFIARAEFPSPPVRSMCFSVPFFWSPSPPVEERE